LTPHFNTDIKIDIPVYKAGAFGFYTTYTPLPDFSPEDVPKPQPTQTSIYYIDIMPRLSIQGSYLPLDAISMCTVLSKLMGKYPSDWHKHLNGISERGYNMIHFTPLMTRGASNSPYSIYDQLEFDRTVFQNGEQDIADLVSNLHDQYGMLALTDVVWNHTAHNSKWLEEHPEAGYSIKTAPHLESAYDLDTALLEFSRNMQKLGYPTNIRSEGDLMKVMDGIKQHAVSKIRLWEFYVVNVERDTDAIVKVWKEGQVTFPNESFGELGTRGIEEVKGWSLKAKAGWLSKDAMIGTDRMGERFRRQIDAKKGAALLGLLLGRYDPQTHETSDERVAHSTVFKLLEEVNLELYREYDRDYSAIIEQLFNRIKYTHIDDHGPKVGPVTEDNPLVESYFTRLPHNETTLKHDPQSLALVNNGWVWAANAMRDHAGPKSRAYLRREVIVWGDCVKLRYGRSREDNPWLWDHIKSYTGLMAKHFAGFRIDNCHSTPIYLAQYMLDEARRVNPNLVVVAELFTGSEEMDFEFTKRLGLSCLIREAMQAWSTQELSRLCHRHMGVPIGSFDIDEVINTVSHEATQANGSTDGTMPSVREIVRVIKQSPVHALFMDCTHDNETPAQKRDARDTLPNTALVAMCACATGSVMGYDEIYPQLIELVHETRPYSSPYSNGQSIKVQAAEGGIGNIKKVLNQIHVLMGEDEYDETYLHHDNEYITVHRQHPSSRKGYYLVAHTAFPGYGNGNGGFPAQHLPGTRAKLLGSWMLDVDVSPESKAAAINDKVLRGLPACTKELRGVTCEWRSDETVIQVPATFPPGSIAIFETWIPGAEHSEGLGKFVTRGSGDACKNLSLFDLNFLLYRCESEERDATSGQDGTYNILGYGSLVYCGLQGWWSVLRDIVRDNNLGHPLCQHLRDGPWALDYIVGRLEKAAKQKRWTNLGEPAHWLRERFAACRKLPTFLMPRYFAMVIQTIYCAAVDRAIELMHSYIQYDHHFVRSLSLVSVQVTGYANSASLWPDKQVPSLAAGLPHFAVEWARCWGRDIMIAMRGLLIVTGRYNDAKEHILTFASVVKHGMIPNLLNSGTDPRYNSRDSVWFFLQCIQDYVKTVPNGAELLQTTTKRRFLPNDDTWFPVDDPRAYSETSTIEDIIQEIMQRHASGLSFVEHNAGPQLDSQMKTLGFDIDIAVDWSNGMIFGGNQWNCGTWMDKMGESEKAGSKGVPGTPRDGAAVEITGLLYSTVNWLDNMRSRGQYKFNGVSVDGGSKVITWGDWAALIKANFERCYYIPRSRDDDHKYDIDSSIVNRRGIYKDLYRSGKAYEDYQLRPNFPIAMVVAPDLFDPANALYALYMADTILRGPQGMATLDPSDYNYRPYYNNAEDSTNFATAKGRNYHQGPEWLWPTGFFLRALLRFDLMRRKTAEEQVESFQQVTRRLNGCMEMILTSPWAGLTELTNKDGEFCGDSVSFALLCFTLLRW